MRGAAQSLWGGEEEGMGTDQGDAEWESDGKTQGGRIGYNGKYVLGFFLEIVVERRPKNGGL